MNHVVEGDVEGMKGADRNRDIKRWKSNRNVLFFIGRVGGVCYKAVGGKASAYCGSNRWTIWEDFYYKGNPNPFRGIAFLLGKS